MDLRKNNEILIVNSKNLAFNNKHLAVSDGDLKVVIPATAGIQGLLTINLDKYLNLILENFKINNEIALIFLEFDIP